MTVPITMPRFTIRGMAEAMGSPRLTVAFFLLMATGSLWIAQFGGDATVGSLPPLLLLTINLMASISTRPRFRADLPLLVFHLALLALVLLLAAARLIYFDGATILTAGTSFEGHLVKDSRGALHGNGLDTLRFANDGFTENFPQRGQYLSTYNRVRWWDEAGGSHVTEIGDDRPLILNGYRIYATARRGFSPTFFWQPATGEGGYGTVQLPDSNVDGMGPAVEWQLPSGPMSWVMLNLDSAPLPQAGAQREGLGEGSMGHHLVLRMGEQRITLKPGESAEIEGGRMTYVRLNSWMGYRIVKDPTEPWVVATVLVGIVSMMWFYVRLLRKPNQQDVLEQVA